ncbi:MAG: hypothetical protein J6M08_08790 [Methanobrevibacter sp.]|nr:hypothetical protein [Methanobrevibacter sp.]
MSRNRDGWWVYINIVKENGYTSRVQVGKSNDQVGKNIYHGKDREYENLIEVWLENDN